VERLSPSLRNSFGPRASLRPDGVIAPAEGIADLRQTVAGALLDARHGNLPRARHRAAAALGQQVRQAHLAVVRHGLLGVLDGDELRLQRQQVAQRFLGELQRDGAP